MWNIHIPLQHMYFGLITSVPFKTIFQEYLHNHLKKNCMYEYFQNQLTFTVLWAWCKYVMLYHFPDKNVVACIISLGNKRKANEPIAEMIWRKKLLWFEIWISFIKIWPNYHKNKICWLEHISFDRFYLKFCLLFSESNT